MVLGGHFYPNRLNIVGSTRFQEMKFSPGPDGEVNTRKIHVEKLIRHFPCAEHAVA